MEFFFEILSNGKKEKVIVIIIVIYSNLEFFPSEEERIFRFVSLKYW